MNNIKYRKPCMKHFTFSTWLATIALMGTLAMTGCATKPTYQSPSSGPKIITNAQGVPNYHVVVRGDTVSQIASRYNLNYRQVGALNGLDSQYTIYSGQYLKLWQGNEGSTNNNVSASNNNSNNNYGNAPVDNNYQASANATSGYGYPSPNQVVRNFDEATGNMGMWFGGQVGDPVYASKEGTVMYSGNGLPEYGNLVMIRHNDDYITAYAHNSQLLVSEGDVVKRGQQVASMGENGQTNQVGLEFQVRLSGNPIDPRAVLGR